MIIKKKLLSRFSQFIIFSCILYACKKNEQKYQFSSKNIKTGVEDTDESWINIVKKHKNFDLYKYYPKANDPKVYKIARFDKKNLKKNKKHFLYGTGLYGSGLLGESKNYKIGSFNVIEIKEENKQKSDEEVTAVMIHGSGGFQIVFADLLKGIANHKFKGKVNILVGKRYNSNCVPLADQKDEIKNQILEYFKNRVNNKKHKLIFCGTSSGAILCLMLLNEFVEKYKESFDVKSVVITSGGLGGINSVEDYLNNLSKRVPFFVKHLELAVFNCEFKNNPPGIVDNRKENIIKYIRKANKYSKTNNIKILNIIGYKPYDMEYESFKNIKAIAKIIFKSIKQKICEFLKKLSNPGCQKKKNNQKKSKKELTCAEKRKRLQTILKEIGTLISMKLSNLKNSPFSTCKITGSRKNDMIYSVKNQKWPYKNSNVEHVLLPLIVHTKYLRDVVVEGKFEFTHSTFQDPIFHEKFIEYLEMALSA